MILSTSVTCRPTWHYCPYINNLSIYCLMFLHHHEFPLLCPHIPECQQSLKSLSCRAFWMHRTSILGLTSARICLRYMLLSTRPLWSRWSRSFSLGSRLRPWWQEVGGMRTVMSSRPSWCGRNSQRRWKIISYQWTGRWMHLHCSTASRKGRRHSWITPQSCRRLVTPLALAEQASLSATLYSRTIFYSFPILSLPSICTRFPPLTMPRPVLMVSSPSCLWPGILWWLSMLSVPQCQQPLSIFLGLLKCLFHSLTVSVTPSNKLMDVTTADAHLPHLVRSNIVLRTILVMRRMISLLHLLILWL